MSQLLKHYLIDRDTGKYALTPAKGYMYPNIRDLNIVHFLFDENNIQYCLSTCPEYFEYSVTVSQETLTEYENNPNITIISSVERQEQITNEQEETITITVYDVTYQEAYVLEETEGLSFVTQEQWDAEIVSYDNRQEEKRINVLRLHRDDLLKQTDWIVIKSTETEVAISTDFKDWRQNLRDLPGIAATSFPAALPQPPEGVSVSQDTYTSYSSEVLRIPMINDPLVSMGTTGQ